MNHSVSTKYGVMRLASSHLETHVSLLSLRLTGEKGLFKPFEAHGLYMIEASLCIGNCSCGIISFRVSQRGDRGHTLELIQTSGVQEHKLLNEAAIWIETPECFYTEHFEVLNFQRLRNIRFLDIS